MLENPFHKQIFTKIPFRDRDANTNNYAMPQIYNFDPIGSLKPKTGIKYEIKIVIKMLIDI